MSALLDIDNINVKKITDKIESTNHQIDKLVYELYDLTPDEIKIVEGDAK